jgi:5'-3' exonuclease
MILIDFSQVFISNAIMQLSKEKSKSIDLDLLRHMIFNSIRSYLVKFRKDFGSEVIIAIDNKNTWRKSVFPQYKANRKKSKDTLNIDWDDLYRNLSIIENELRDNTPYKVLRVDECEADDIIASIAIKYSDFNKI